MSAQALPDFVTVDPVSDPEERLHRRQNREQVIIRRAKLLERARFLVNRQKLADPEIFTRKHGYMLVMRPETLDFIRRSQSELDEGRRDFSYGEKPLLGDVPIYFSDELETDQIILAKEGWPYFGPDDFPGE